MRAPVPAPGPAAQHPAAPGSLASLAASPARFALPAASLEITTAAGPEGFHALLHALVRGARRRLSVASLYFGTGKLESELLDELVAALERTPALQVRLVFDHSRGRRRTDNGTSMSFLQERLARFGARVELYLHRMPQFDGARAWLPSPLDECVAVCHFKALVADDTAVLTGANLSDEYFHCRQARYLIVREPRFAAMMHDVVDVAAAHSLRVGSGPGLLAPRAGAATGLPAALARAVGTAERPQAAGADDGSDTCLVPVFQHPDLGLQEERALLGRLFAWRGGQLVVGTPYTNFPADYVAALGTRLAAGPAGGARTLIVAPSGSSHSFTTGRGLKALVPGVYLHRERQLMTALRAAGPVELRHYHRPGWVFHSKGVWLETADETATIIGSSSYGLRSVARDFDLSFLLVTRDARLRAGLAGEIATMLAHARAPEASDRPAMLASRLLVPIARRYM